MSYVHTQDKAKFDSRADLAELLFGHFGGPMPADRQWWSLANTQPPVGSEIAQLVDLGLINANQFHGVDDNPDIIRENAEWWKEAHWHCGSWARCTLSYHNFNPGCVFYDSTNTPVAGELYRDVVATMRRCPPRTMVCVNVMMNDACPPWGKHDPMLFLARLEDELMSDWKLWSSNIQMGTYKQKGKHTTMGMYALVSR